MANFDEDIKRITNEVLEDGTVDQIIKENIVEGFKKAINDSFRFGKLNDAITNRVREVLVPYIEDYDMQKYIAKLDTVLTDIVNSTNLMENKKILENFGILMKKPEIETITVSGLFEQYKKFVSKNVDTDGRGVNYDDGVRYEAIEVLFEIDEEDGREWSSFDHAVLELSVEEEEQQGKLNRTIRLSRYKQDRKEGWDIRPEADPTIRSLRYLDEFDLFVISLYRAGVKLIGDKHSDWDMVYPEKEPDLTYV